MTLQLAKTLKNKPHARPEKRLVSRMKLPAAMAVAAILSGATVYCLRNMPDMTITAAISKLTAPEMSVSMPARTVGVCCGTVRINCVVDGDTVWLDGVKIRIANIDAPEIDSRCTREKHLALNAKAKLQSLLSGHPFSIRASGVDRFGRALATIATKSGDVGVALVRSNLAIPWMGHKADVEIWCPA